MRLNAITTTSLKQMTSTKIRSQSFCKITLGKVPRKHYILSTKGSLPKKIANTQALISIAKKHLETNYGKA